MARQVGPWMVVTALLAVACQGSPAATMESSAAPSAPAGSPSAGVGGVALAERLEAEIAVPGSPDWPQAAYGSVWVLAPDLPIRSGGGTPNLVRIDPTSNTTTATIGLPDRLCQGFVATADAIWVCSADGLVRVDPASDEITDSIAIEDVSRAFYQPLFGDGAIWLLGSASSVSDTLLRFEPTDGSSAGFTMPAPIGGLAYGFEAVWLTQTGAGEVIRVDPATGASQVVATGLAAPAAIAIGADSLWVALQGDPEEEARPGDAQLVRVDPASGAILAEFEIGGSPQGGVQLWAGEGGVLVRSTQPWLVRIDELTNRVVDTVIGDPIQGPVTYAFGSIWTVNVERDIVFRIAP